MNKELEALEERLHEPSYVLSCKEINELRNLCYENSNSWCPLSDFFNDICLNKSKTYNKNQAFKDLWLIALIVLDKLKEMQEDKEMLNIFKNALTVERNIPPELEIKESEKGCSYVFKEAVKIHENRIEEMLKKSLKEWVLKNAFPKELKALDIIKEKKVDTTTLFICFKDYNLETYNECVNPLAGELSLTQQEYDLFKEVLL